MLKRMFQVLWIRATADKRKFGVMCGLFAVGMLLWARLIILEKIPRTGLAEPSSSTPAPGSKASSAGSRNLDPGPNKDRELPVVLVDTTSILSRNLFLMPSAFLPQPLRSENSTDLAPKSRAETPEDAMQEERMRSERIADEAGRLHLLSVILGSTPAAIVDGELVTVGGVVKGFELIEVRDRSVVMEKDGVRIEIRMHTPGMSG